MFRIFYRAKLRGGRGKLRSFDVRGAASAEDARAAVERAFSQTPHDFEIVKVEPIS
jgi:hypothetical protein